MTLVVTLEPVTDIAALEQRWRALETHCVASFFLGWTWMGSWLSACVEGTAPLPDLLAVQRGGEDVALALVGHSVERRTFGRARTWWLNQAGHGDADRPFIEYNGLLVRAQDANEAARAAWDAIMTRRDWSALMLSGMAPDDALLTAAPAVRRRTLRDSSPAYFMDLHAVRAAKGDALSLLSSNTRSQIKRSIKDQPGDIVIDRAQDDATVTDWLAEMKQMNSGRHADNAWDLPIFQRFAAHITRAGMAGGSVELLRLCCSNAALGYLLNFVHNGCAMNYQSAFAEPLTPRSKPGLMCHMAAASRYADAGLERYSLLAGKDRYKQSLSTGAEELHWLRLERFTPALEAEACVRRILRR
ncbi:GNAT family N-acetyltransferase [Sphingobium subterraneum]|uniref:CelD/BcsL family acetyltransferase involved in cellulose biosynthesis n=1 Tax=Sphingobium subterraneum TaxID=627688 RepID=A0A841J0F7_9SPHN|nr:GNAT family N-acetyltransferase [Sphingobium subterraneum]MBB6124184.1 CelD/BcsL family acetyltransferase involved in cellulose biosynthesis [Sphingobium subterraneum]